MDYEPMEMIPASYVADDLRQRSDLCPLDSGPAAAA